MVLHFASQAAFLVDQVQPAPVVVQCAQPAPAPRWKFWVQSVIPVAGGTLIAVWSFIANRNSEQRQWERNQEAARNQWVRDQKKAEWSQLLRSVAEVHRVLRVVSTTEKQRAELIAEGLKPAVHELVIAQANCIFLHAFFADPKRGKRFFSFLAEADAISEKISGLLSLIRVPLDGSSAKEKMGQLTEIQDLTRGITDRFFELQRWLREEAASSLDSPTS
jgi:hypothetical protein